jgi:hypothetical protein
MFDKLTNKEAMDFIAKVGEPFKTLPHLPKGLVEFFVKAAPWLAAIGAVLNLIGGVVIGLIGTLGSLFTLNPIVIIATVALGVIALASSILLFSAFKPLSDREMKGWVFLFWVEMLNIASAIISLVAYGTNGIIGTIIGTLVGLYFLYEMKPFFGKAQAVVEKAKK